MSAPLDISIQGFSIREVERSGGERIVEFVIPQVTRTEGRAVVRYGDPVKVLLSPEQFDDLRVFMAVILSAREKLVRA